MAQQIKMKLIEMPDHTPENPSLNEAQIAKHNLMKHHKIPPTFIKPMWGNCMKMAILHFWIFVPNRYRCWLRS